MSIAQRFLTRCLAPTAPLLPAGVSARPGRPGSGAGHLMRAVARFRPAAHHPALLTMTVEQADLSRVRTALNYSGARSVEFVRVVPMRGSTRVQLEIGLELEAVEATMSKIIDQLDEGEFGRVKLR